MKNLLVTCYFKHNYGSMLQAYATQYFLDIRGYDNKNVNISELLDFKNGKRKYYFSQIFNIDFYKSKIGMIKFLIRKKISCSEFKKNIQQREKKFEEFKDKYFKLTEPVKTYEDLGKKCNYYDNVIVGSDQLWLPVNIVADFYTLNFVPDGVNKISYATSFGVSVVPTKLQQKYQSFLNRINYISVREQKAVELIYEITGKYSTLVCDPTMLLCKNEWDLIACKERIIKDSYIFCYFLGKNKEHRKFVEKLKKKTGYKIISINHCDEYVKYSDIFCDMAPYDVGPEEWLNLLSNAEYVCTDSFHGTIFSLIYNKKFYSFRRHSSKSSFSTNSRLESLLNMLDLTNILLTGCEEVEQVESEINYEIINYKLKKFRDSSICFFEQALLKNGD